MGNQKKERFQIKMVVLGDFATGKTSLLNRMITGKFDTYQQATIGAAFNSLDQESKYGTPLRYMIWDTAGQERYRALTSLYFRNADVILICFDVSSPESFNNIKDWIDLIENECKRKDSLIVLIANKDDLEWRVKKEDIRDFAKNTGITYYITSALQNQGISELMEGIRTTCECRWRSEMIAFLEDNNDTVVISRKNVTPDSDSCCIIA